MCSITQVRANWKVKSGSSWLHELHATVFKYIQMHLILSNTIWYLHNLGDTLYVIEYTIRFVSLRCFYSFSLACFDVS